MGVETGDTIASLNPAWPTGAEQIAQGDDHIRQIKHVLLSDALSKADGGDVVGAVSLGVGSTAPDVAFPDNSTKIANTAFVSASILSSGGGGGALSLDTASGTTIDTGEQFRLIMLSTGSVVAIPYSAVAPAAPSGFAVVVRLTSVTLTWTAVASATSYVIHRDGVQIGTTSNLIYRDIATVVGDTYSYTVSSVDAYRQRSPASAAVTAFIDASLNATPTDVVISCWPTPIPTDGPAVIRVNAIDIDVQNLAFTLGVDAGSLTATQDPSVWIFRI